MIDFDILTFLRCYSISFTFLLLALAFRRTLKPKFITQQAFIICKWNNNWQTIRTSHIAHVSCTEWLKAKWKRKKPNKRLINGIINACELFFWICKQKWTNQTRKKHFLSPFFYFFVTIIVCCHFAFRL